MKKVALRLTSSKISSKSKIKIDFIVITDRFYKPVGRDTLRLHKAKERVGREAVSPPTSRSALMK
jgi:hypothetical protein